MELATSLRAQRADIPIILATGFNASADPGETREVGINAVINKPVGPDDLLDAVHAVLHTGD